MSSLATAPDGSWFAGVDVFDAFGAVVLPTVPRARFEDDVWDFRGATNVGRSWKPNRLITNWGLITNPIWRMASKELAIARSPHGAPIERLLGGRRSVRFETLSEWPKRLQHWFDFLEQEDIHSFEQVTQGTCDAFLAMVGDVHPSNRRRYAMHLQDFALYQDAVSADRYAVGFSPWPGIPAAIVGGYTEDRTENKTLPIPDDVYGPILAAAMFWVDVAGPDVLAAIAEDEAIRAALPEPVVKPGNTRQGRGAQDARLAEWLQRQVALGQPLPRLPRRSIMRIASRGWTSDGLLRDVDFGLIAQRSGCRLDRSSVPEHRLKLIEEAFHKVGVGPSLQTPASLVETPAGMGPWCDGFDAEDIITYRSYCKAATAIVVCALSGMRHAEVLEIKRGALRRIEYAPGRERWRLVSKVTKTRERDAGEDDWTVVAEVARAIQLQEALTDTDHLFSRQEIGHRARLLRQWTNTYGASAGLAPIPTDWEVNGRQFRRTMARLLGFRSHGVIAGRIQLKHVSVATSEGYFGKRGSSAASFLADVEKERAQAREDEVRRLFDEWLDGHPIGGIGATELATVFARAAEEVGAFDGAVIDEDRLLELVKRRTDALHPGTLAHCWFVDPARARCLRSTTITSDSRPLVGSCEPTRCANATIHPEHAPVWLSKKSELHRLATDTRVPKLERQRLAAELARVSSVVDSITQEGEPT